MNRKEKLAVIEHVRESHKRHLVIVGTFMLVVAVVLTSAEHFGTLTVAEVVGLVFIGLADL